MVYAGVYGAAGARLSFPGLYSSFRGFTLERVVELRVRVGVQAFAFKARALTYFSNNQGEKRLNFNIPTETRNPKSLKFS